MATQSIRLSDGTNTLLPEAAQSGNGYCKMADGTLLCYGSKAVAFTDTGTEDVTLTFAIPFATSPICVCSRCATESTQYEEAYAMSWTTTDITIRYRNYFAGQNNVYAAYLAIGRWK